ncbi:hypothetical protein K440DRAFT_280911 [Wilcoxina mikolae CBS 423.85]|nr:hypothetical protein K440DRAFT_280911 [Wilcoxina mikolae CBS 423.85]
MSFNLLVQPVLLVSGEPAKLDREPAQLDSPGSIASSQSPASPARPSPATPARSRPASREPPRSSPARSSPASREPARRDRVQSVESQLSSIISSQLRASTNL